MAIELGFNLFEDLLVNTFVLNLDWALSIIITLISLLIITRDYNKWKGLAFPIMVMWHIAGITPSILIYIISAIIFAVDALSLQLIGSLLGTITDKVGKIKEPSADQKYYKSIKRKIRRKTMKSRAESQFIHDPSIIKEADDIIKSMRGR